MSCEHKDKALNYLLDKNETSLWHHNRFWDKTKTDKKGRKISGNSHSILFINMVDGGAKEINGGANQHVTIKAPDKKSAHVSRKK